MAMLPFSSAGNAVSATMFRTAITLEHARARSEQEHRSIWRLRNFTLVRATRRAALASMPL
jgi:hypothetical protein